MRETSPETLDNLPGSALVERQRALTEEENTLSKIFHSRMTRQVNDVFRKNGANQLEILGCRHNELFLPEIDARSKETLVSKEAMDAIIDDLKGTDCVENIYLTDDDQHGFTRVIVFDLEKLDA